MSDLRAEQARSERLLRMNEGLTESVKTIPRLNTRIALLEQQNKKQRIALQQIRDLTDATKTPNWTVREVLLTRHLCDAALGGEP